MYKTALWSVLVVSKMRPLSKSTARELLKRLNAAEDSEVREILIMSPTSFKIELSVQDPNRGYDWINIAFEISGITDALLVDDAKLSYLDMSNGIGIIFENENIGFTNSKCESLSKIRENQLYFIGASIKYEELPFREF